MKICSSNPGPSGSRGPATRSQSALTTEVEPPSDLVCEFPGCGREFTTKTGKGLHQRRAHSDWMDAQQNTAAIKGRWNDEETLLLARKEVELTRHGVRFINQAIIDIFPGRTLEGIKGKRKQPAYKALVQELLSEAPGEPNGGRIADHSDETDYWSAIADCISALPPSASADFKSARLQNICDSLQASNPEAVMMDLALYLREVFPHKARKARDTSNRRGVVLSKRQARRAEYA